MPIDKGFLNNEEKKFLAYLVSQHPARGPNDEIHSIFRAIQTAFTPTASSRDAVVVDTDLVANLSACAWVALCYDHNDRIPMDRAERDYVIYKTLRSFIFTLVNAVKTNKLSESKSEKGKMYFGCLHIPEWFMLWARDWAWHLER